MLEKSSNYVSANFLHYSGESLQRQEEAQTLTMYNAVIMFI